MVCVFGSFVVADARAIKLIGLGLAIAVLIDATLVRMALVPATMELLGRTNWWLPRWLDRLVPRFVVERHPASARLDLATPADLTGSPRHRDPSRSRCTRRSLPAADHPCRHSPLPLPPAPLPAP